MIVILASAGSASVFLLLLFLAQESPYVKREDHRDGRGGSHKTR
jgi:hypothetical protein